MRKAKNWRLKVFLILGLPVSLGACSAFPAPDAGGPRSNQPQYPIQLAEDPRQVEEALVYWQRIAHSLSIPDRTKIQLHPYTATILSLPPNTPLFLPKIGSADTMSEEETRESLRRFLRDWQGLIGSNPDQLSLTERADLPDGTKVALYTQHPFKYPLRGPYGSLRIRFNAERRILELKSTCIPNADKLQSSIASLSPQITREEATNRVMNASVSIVGASGQQSFYQLSSSNRPEARELVIYAKDPHTVGGTLELRLAWEIAVSNAPVKLVYLDAIKGEIIGTL